MRTLVHGARGRSGSPGGAAWLGQDTVQRMHAAHCGVRGPRGRTADCGAHLKIDARTAARDEWSKQPRP